MLHLVRFHGISGEVKVVEGSEFTCMATGRQSLEVVCITILNQTFVANHHGHASILNFSVGLGAVRLLIIVI